MPLISYFVKATFDKNTDKTKKDKEKGAQPDKENELPPIKGEDLWALQKKVIYLHIDRVFPILLSSMF